MARHSSDEKLAFSHLSHPSRAVHQLSCLALAAYERIETDQFGIPDLWDGQAAQRIARILVEA